MQIQLSNETIIECDEVFSLKNFTGQYLTDLNLDNLIIYGSCFSHEIPNTQIFPSGMTGVTFYNCNLDNCFIPEGNTIIDCSQRRFKANPEDGKDWRVDDQGNFLQLL